MNRRVTKPDQTGRARAERMYPPEPCAVCGAPYSKTGSNVGRHHVDGDRMNNTPENIVFLCKPHHVAAHRARGDSVGGGPRPRVVALMRDRAMRGYAMAVDLREAGWTTRQIAETLNVDTGTVSRWFRKYGVG